jgi:hypothetical protein
MKFRKKPVVIDALQFTGGPESATVIIDWVLQQGGTARYYDATGTNLDSIRIDTLEGTMRADVGDWIIKGTQGEFYPCKPDIFAEIYETEYAEENNEETDMEFKKFIRKPFVVEAVEVTRENIHELSDLIGEYGEDENGPYIDADRNKVPTVFKVIPGYWVTKMGKNIRCYSSRVFNEQFTRSTPETEKLVESIDG